MNQALQDITGRIRAAAATGSLLRIRGGGTKDFYGEDLRGEILDTRVLAGVTSYEPSELVVSVRAGTPLAELEALLAESGQCLPFEPPRFGPGGTVGGMVAAGLSGPSRANAGSVRDYVLGASLINGRGEALIFGGTVMKNVAGYDVSRVLAGSMGTLGLITDVSLKVLPVAPAESTLRFAMDQAQALRALNNWGGQPLPLNASCWLHEADVGGGGGVLYVRLRGAVAAVAAARSKMGGDEAAFDWQALRDQTHAFFAASEGMGLWRLSVAQSAPVIVSPASISMASGFSPLIEWHGGQRWLHAPLSETPVIRAAALSAGGHATLWRGSEDAPSRRSEDAPSRISEDAPSRISEDAPSRISADRPDMDKILTAFAAPAAPLGRMNRALRESFDPAGVFNTGRL